MFSLLQQLSVRNRIWAIVVLLIGGIVAGGSLDILLLREALWQEREQKTRQLVDSGYAVLAHFHELQRRGRLPEAEARAAALAAIRALRYDGTGYFWINDLGTPFPRMLMHPTAPELDGRVLDAAEFERATRQRVGDDGPFAAIAGSRNLFAAFVDVASRGGRGYVAYDWPKPLAAGGRTAELYPKLSYVKHFEPWGWVIGTGVYVDDVEAAVRARVERGALLVAGFAAVLLLLSAVVAGSIIRPLRQALAAMRAIGDGDLGRRLPVAGRSEIAELAAGFNDMLARLRAHEAELARHREALEEEVARRTGELQEANRRLAGELAERRQAEQALHENRARMRALLDAASESVLLLAPDGRILAINAFAAGRFGSTPEAMLGSDFFALMPPALAASRRAAVEHVAATGEPMRVHDRRGATFFDSSLYPVLDGAGAVESVAVYAKDVSEAHRAKEVEDTFRQLDQMLLKWRMNLDSIAQMFCEQILPVFDLAAAWIGRAEKDGRLAFVAGAEGGSGGLLDPLRANGLRWRGEGACCLPTAAVIESGSRQLLSFDEPACRSCHAAAHGAGAAAVLLLPLTLRGETWGVLALYGREARQFQDAALTLRLASIAGRLGVSLESAVQQEWLTLLDTALAGVDNAVFITDAGGRILWANASVAQLSGYAPEDILGKTPQLFDSGVQDADFYRRFWDTLRAGRTWRGDIVNARRDGSRYTLNQTVTPLLGYSGQISHYVAVAEDVSERRAMEDKVRHSANYDLLTDLPNRGLFLDRLGQALAMARRDGRTGALLFLDLDRFKEVNDRFGHAAGDRLLVAIAGRLRGVVRESDTVARLAGDEFTVILPQLQGIEDAVRVADKIIAAVGEPVAIPGGTATVGVSIGIALFPGQGNSVEQLVNAADHAMYLAKQAGRNRYAQAVAA